MVHDCQEWEAKGSPALAVYKRLEVLYNVQSIKGLVADAAARTIKTMPPPFLQV